MDSKNFSAFEIDAIGEILNISLGASATAVSAMLDARVDITTPVVRVLSKEEFEISNLEPAVGVEITYIAGLSGSNLMLLKRHDVKVIVDMLMGMETPEEGFELNELNISAICEVMNQMMGASATALSEFLGKTVNISTPASFEIGDVADFKDKYYDKEDYMVAVGFNLKIADQMESEFINVMSLKLAKDLVRGFLPEVPEPEISLQPENGRTSEENQEIPQKPGDDRMAVQRMMDQIQAQQEMMDQMQQMISRLQNEQQDMRRTGFPEPKTINVKPVPKNSFDDWDHGFEEQEENRELIMGVPLEVSVEIGRTRKLVKEILEFTKGSLVILDKLAGEQVDLYVNDRCIAKGDVVVVDDNFGIRITEITKKGGEQRGSGFI